MNSSLQQAILQIYPQAARIIDIHSFRPGYLPYPARLTLQTTTGDTVICVIKASENAGKINHEAHVLRALAELKLPVPEVLAGPITVPDTSPPLTIMLIGELPGQPLPWLRLTDLAIADQTCRLVHTAIDCLHALTPEVQAHPVAALVPSKTLESEVQTIRARHSAWFDVPLFNEALELVEAALPLHNSPLVFSNGDYNPLNFLTADDELVGFIDFEYACFEDPYIGFAKFLLWADDDFGWGAGAKSGLVERFLYTHQVPPSTFLVRLVLRGLSHVQDTSPANPPHYMLQVISDAMHRF